MNLIGIPTKDGKEPDMPRKNAAKPGDNHD
jgi:hypothetical protein